MGISGLLPLLKPIQRETHLSAFSGKTLGVDGYVWLHKGVFSCAVDLARGIPTKKYVSYFMRRVGMLLDFGITPYIVFDGGPLPMKLGTELERRERRRVSREKGHAYWQSGLKSKAAECYQTSVDVTPFMAYQVIKELKRLNIKYIVAPYEADSQLAFLDTHGLIDGVITEDSDLLVFGCRVVLVKMSPTGSITEIRLDDIHKLSSFQSCDIRKFRQMCILSGCDYLPSPPGIGLKTAIKHLKTMDAEALIKYWIKWGTSVKAPQLPEGYLESYQKAELTFLHQTVYNPVNHKLVPLSPFSPDMCIFPEIIEFLGPILDPELAISIAIGEVDPISKDKFSEREIPAVFHGTKRPFADTNHAHASAEAKIILRNSPVKSCFLVHVPEPEIAAVPSVLSMQSQEKFENAPAQNHLLVKSNSFVSINRKNPFGMGRPPVFEKPLLSMPREMPKDSALIFGEATPCPNYEEDRADPEEKEFKNTIMETVNLTAEEDADCIEVLTCFPEATPFNENLLCVDKKTMAFQRHLLAAAKYSKPTTSISKSQKTISTFFKLHASPSVIDGESWSHGICSDKMQSSVGKFAPRLGLQKLAKKSIFDKGKVARGIGAKYSSESSSKADIIPIHIDDVVIDVDAERGGMQEKSTSSSSFFERFSFKGIPQHGVKKSLGMPRRF